MKYTALYEKTENWWIGWIQEVPGAHTQGKTLDECRENLKDALELILEVNKELPPKENLHKEIIEIT